MRRVLGLVAVAVCLAVGGAANAQTPAPTPALDTLVAPIALYPDPLLASVLAASTFPVQIVEADRAIANGAKPSAGQMSQWDTSVQALTAYPSVLGMMSNQLDWTTELGQAVSKDQKAVMAAVQQVRAEAQKAGNLQSNDKQTVTTSANAIIIEPANPEIIYVPQYNPVAILEPAPAYAMAPAGYGLMTFGVGFAAGAMTAYACDWNHGGSITVNNNYNYSSNYNRNTNVNANSSKYSSWKAPTDVGRIDSPGSTNVGSGSSGSRYAGGQRDGGDEQPRANRGGYGGQDDEAGRGAGALGGADRAPGSFGGGDRWGSQGGMFGGANGGGWASRAASDRGARSFGGGGFGGGFGGFHGGGRRF